MINIINWCTKKENVKIIFMLGLAVILLIALQHLFSRGKETHKADSSEAMYENRMESQTQAAKRIKDEKMLKSSNAKTIKYDNLQPPPYLTRDIFSFRNSGDNSIRSSDGIIPDNLELNATIIDDGEPLAIIGNKVMGIGEFVNGLEVREIKNNEVVLAKGEQKYILRMIQK